MNIQLTEVLQSLRDIYDVDGVMPRFDTYRSLMLGDKRGEFLPLGAFSPMGSKQPAYLDRLIELGAETVANEAIAEAASKLSFLPEYYRLALVVVDEKHNSWTQRYITDAEWRLQNKYDEIPQSAKPIDFDRWITVQLWTCEQPTPEYIFRETQTAIFRAAHRTNIGIAKSLREMMDQEGRAMAFSGFRPKLELEDLNSSRHILERYYDATDFRLCFSALYGDEITRNVGYQTLGLASHAGFDVGLALALKRSETDKDLFNIENKCESAAD